MPELGSEAESQPILMGREGLVQRSWQNAGFFHICDQTFVFEMMNVVAIPRIEYF